MPTPSSLTRLTHLSLSVTDLDRSLAFYRDVLGLPVFVPPFEGEVFDGREALLLVGGMALNLQAHRRTSGDAFDPSRTGLDHLAFSVATQAELEAWAQHLSDQGVAHSGIKPVPGYGVMIELRDPDGIQLELHLLQLDGPDT